MTTLIKHKRVEFSELFYDLVFVFAISKATTLIEHLHNGILTWNSLLDFFIATLVLIDSCQFFCNSSAAQLYNSRGTSSHWSSSADRSWNFQ